jgi:broad specificity phosphatase PhoE
MVWNTVSREMSRTLLFIRHSAVQIDPEKPAREWPLSEDGRSRTRRLVPQIASHKPACIITSEESKAVETGQIIAAELNLPWQTAPNLHEHDRQGVPFLADKEEFETAVARFFRHPDQLIFGNETANQVLERFDTAVHALIATYPTDTLAIVTHGTVLTLFLAYYNQIDPLTFWKKLKLPDFFVVTLPNFTFHVSRFTL